MHQMKEGAVMSFRENQNQQFKMTDSLNALTTREQKALQNSWAKVFADEVFPSIDEKRFSVIYSDKDSRPNTPVNIIVGALIIKELFGYSDDDMVEGLMLDSRLQYALHTTSFDEQPLSDKTLSRFRKRCYEYETLHNVDLYRDCIKDLSGKIAKMMKINGSIKRMDSMMIESNIRLLSRMELIYTCISKLVGYLMKKAVAGIPEILKPYADPNNYNRVFHHQKSVGRDELIRRLLTDSDLLLEICGTAYEDVTEYELFVRCLSEQTIEENGKRRLRTKEDATMDSGSLQNPSDPDATYRKKSGKSYRGYTANIEESVGENGSIVTDYRYEPNIYSDSQFLQDSMAEAESHETETTLITDGGYAGGDNILLAREKNVRLITTALVGKDAPDIFADFEFNDDGTKLLKCAAGHAPKSCSYIEPTGQCRVSFNKELCFGCQHREQCNPKIGMRVAAFITSKNASDRAKHQRYMHNEEFKDYARLRNGVETIPSNLRRNYDLETLPRGKQRGKFFFGCKVAALNFRKLFNFRRESCCYAKNPILT